MRISTKGRYGLAAMTILAQKNGYHTAEYVSNQLGVSKIYMEQVFAMLKKAGLISSQKGSSGGYILSDKHENITIYQILKATESSLFEPTQSNIAGENFKNIESILVQKVWQPIDSTLEKLLSSITLEDLATNATDDMFFI